jgi:hypothetical protein
VSLLEPALAGPVLSCLLAHDIARHAPGGHRGRQDRAEARHDLLGHDLGAALADETVAEFLDAGRGELGELHVTKERRDVVVEMLALLHDRRGFEAARVGLDEPECPGFGDGDACGRRGMDPLFDFVLYLGAPRGRLALSWKRFNAYSPAVALQLRRG